MSNRKEMLMSRGRQLAFPAILSAVVLGSSALADDDERHQRNDRAFFLSGTAENARDPENPANEVIRIRTDVPPFFGAISRRLNVKIQTLDNQLESKFWLQTPKTCVGGSPRMQLAIDLDGDGRSDGNAFGYFGVSPFGAGCPFNVWIYEDLTGGDTITGPGPGLSGPPNLTPNEEMEWDASQLANRTVGPVLTLPPGTNAQTLTWTALETAVSAFPNHQVCSGAVVDDTFGAPGQSGTAYYDLISIGNATWNNHNDTASRRGSRLGCERDREDRDDDD
jgi:hypothetical protein